MGADGHICIYDAGKVDAKARELGAVRDDGRVDLPYGWYRCAWKCNGKDALVAYWGDSPNCYDATQPGELMCNDGPTTGALMVWANENAVLVENQEVWT